MNGSVAVTLTMDFILVFVSGECERDGARHVIIPLKGEVELNTASSEMVPRPVRILATIHLSLDLGLR